VMDLTDEQRPIVMAAAKEAGLLSNP